MVHTKFEHSNAKSHENTTMLVLPTSSNSIRYCCVKRKYSRRPVTYARTTRAVVSLDNTQHMVIGAVESQCCRNCAAGRVHPISLPCHATWIGTKPGTTRIPVVDEWQALTSAALISTPRDIAEQSAVQEHFVAILPCFVAYASFAPNEFFCAKVLRSTKSSFQCHRFV